MKLLKIILPILLIAALVVVGIVLWPKIKGPMQGTPSSLTAATDSSKGGATAQSASACQPVATADSAAAEAMDDSYRQPASLPATSFVPGQVIIKFEADVGAELFRQSMQKGQTKKFNALSAQDVKEAAPDLTDLGVDSLAPVFAPSAFPATLSGLSAQERISSQDLKARSGNAYQFFVATINPDRATPDNLDELQTAADKITDHPKVEYSEPNYVAYATPLQQAAAFSAPSGRQATPAFTPNDPFYPHQWNMIKLQMPQAWEAAKSGAPQKTLVAVLDTGIAQAADDLDAASFVGGYNFIANSTNTADDNGHGTHVAGTLVQHTNNGIGVSGVAYYNARLMPVKVLDARGQGSFAQIIAGINYAVVSGAKIINMSLTASNGSQALEDAVNQARANGVIIVAAAGNQGGAVGYPAAYPNVVAVGAIRCDETRAYYSNLGPQIDVVAPGGDNNVDQNADGFGDGIVQQTFKTDSPNTFRYLFLEGTSMATPHVSGVLALLLSNRPNLTPDAALNALYASVKDLGSPGRDDEFGRGLVQACSALAQVGVNCNATAGEIPTPTATSPILPPTPTATPSAPASPTPTPPVSGTPTTPPVSGNLIINPGFEDNTGWIFPNTPRPGRYTTNKAHTGARSALVGITDPGADWFSYSSAAQRVTLPADAQRITLSAFVYPVSSAPGCDIQLTLALNDRFRVIEQFSNTLSNAQTWQQQSFDLTHLKGRSVYVYFGAVNTFCSGVTAMYIDDVLLTVER